MTFHQLSPTEAMHALDSDPASGLNTQQVREKLTQFGENKLKEKKKKNRRFSASWPNSRML